MVWKRWLPASGIVFVVLVIFGVVVLGGDTPGDNASAAKVASFYDDNETRQEIATFFLAAAAPFAVFFAASLAAAHWPTDERRPIWELVLAAGGAVVAVAVAATSFIHFVLAAAAGNGVVGDAIRSLNMLDADTWTLFNPALGVMMLGAAGVLLPRASSSRWMGWVALVLGIALFIPFADFFGLLLTLLWLLVQSVMMLRDTRQQVGSTPAAAAA